MKKLEDLPDSLILKILEYCDPLEIVNLGQLSRSLKEVCEDQMLWRTLFHRYFKLSAFHPSPTEPNSTWKDEFIRLHDRIPIVECEKITDHGDQVLHVSFSNDGTRFATTGKDAYVRVWSTEEYPVELEFSYKMKSSKYFAWEYTQFSEFNESDTLLLVSGVYEFGVYSTAGEIAIFSLQNDTLELQCRTGNKPYDVFGAWYSDHYFLSGDLRWLNHRVSRSDIWLNKASQETDSEHTAIMNHLYKFYNPQNSSLRSILVANLPLKSHRSGKRLVTEELCKTSNSKSLKKDGDACAGNSRGTVGDKRDDLLTFLAEESDSHSSDDDDEVMDPHEKLLIFTCGSKTYTPHQIGFKQMKPFPFKGRLELGLSLPERIALKRLEDEEAELHPRSPISYDNYERVAHLFDKIDTVIDLHGHVIGMTLSPDHRYLYVNCRPWPADAIISDPMEPPPIAQEIDIHIIDLRTLKQVGIMPRAHRAYTPNEECFFIFLDACNQYLASGAEDRAAFVWERNYSIPLVRLPHTDVVNSVAFNPENSEMLVSVSDDHSIKLWRSKRLCRELGINYQNLVQGTQLLKQN